MRQLIEQYVPHVYRFAVRLSGDALGAEDVTQEVMLRAWRHRRRLREPRAARVWLFRIAVNVWNDELRRRHACGQRTELIHDVASTDLPPDEASIQKEQVRRAMEVLDTLPERQRSVVYLHVCEQLDLGEIAEVLAISYAAAKASLSAGRQQMRNKLRDVYQDIATVTRKLM